MKVLVTGATGFLGSHLVKALLKKGHEVIILKRSFSDSHRIAAELPRLVVYDLDCCSLDQPFRDHGKIDAVIHAATCYGRKGENASEILETNVALPLRILQKAIFFGIGAFLNTDTYFNKGQQVYSYLSQYVLSKRQFLEWGRQLAETGGIRFINIKLEHVYGPHDSQDKFVNQVIWACLNNQANLKLTFGQQRRDFIFIDDVSSAYLLLIEKQKEVPAGFQNSGLGTGKTFTIREFVELVHSLVGSKTCLDFGAIPYRPNEIMESRADTDLLKKIGWAWKVDLREGIERTLAQMRDPQSSRERKG